MGQQVKRQLDAGKRWIEQLVLRYAKEFGVSVQIPPRAWSDEQEHSDGTKDSVRFVPLVNGKSRRDERLVFKVDDLTDIPGTKSLSAELEGSIREVPVLTNSVSHFRGLKSPS